MRCVTNLMTSRWVNSTRDVTVIQKLPSCWCEEVTRQTWHLLMLVKESKMSWQGICPNYVDAPSITCLQHYNISCVYLCTSWFIAYGNNDVWNKSLFFVMFVLTNKWMIACVWRQGQQFCAIVLKRVSLTVQCAFRLSRSKWYGKSKYDKKSH